MNIFQELDTYFSSDQYQPQESLMADKNNDYIIKLLAMRYIIHPKYILELNEYYNSYTFYTTPVDEFLKHCKYIIRKNMIDVNQWKIYVKSLPKEFKEDAVFKEFAQEFPKRMNEAFDRRDIEFFYQVLSKEEIALFSPTLRKKLGMKKRVSKKEREEIKTKFVETTLNKIKQFELQLKESLSKKDLDICKNCALKNQPAVSFDFLQGNKDSTDIDIVFVGMNPYKDEIKEGKPFVGKSGKYLREYIAKYFSYLNVVITNSVMCFIPDNGDPDQQTIENCSKLLNYQITQVFQPKVVVPLGKIAISAVSDKIDIDQPFTQLRKKFYTTKFNDKILCVPTMHPSGIIRSLNKYGTVYDEDFQFILDSLNVSQSTPVINQSSTNEIKRSQKNNIKSLDSWKNVKELISQGYKVVNAQDFKWIENNDYNNPKDILCCAIFSTPDLKDRLYFNINDLPYEYFVCIKKEHEGIGPLEPISTCKKESIKFSEHLKNRYEYMRVKSFRLFEGDISPNNKFMNECKNLATEMGIETKTESVLYASKVGYIDIEVQSTEGFTKPENPTQPVIMFSYTDSEMEEILIVTHREYADIPEYTQNDKILEKYIDKETLKKFENVRYKLIVLENEKALFDYLENLIKTRKLDVLTAWNAWYDFNYLTNRAKLLGYDLTLSPLGIIGYISSRTGLYKAPGTELVDMIEIYKSTKNKELPSYRLDYVANLEINIGKVSYDGSINELFKDPEKATIYNMVDVWLLKHLDSKLKLFESKFTQRVLQGCSLSSMTDTVVPFTNICIQYARKKGLAIRSKLKNKKTHKFEGAFTRAFKPGVNLLVIDFDQSVTGDMSVTIKRNNTLFDVAIQDYEYQEGDKVLTLSNNHKVYFEDVLGKIEHDTKYDILEIETESGEIIKVTENHSVFIYDDMGNIKLVEGKDLKPGDRLVTC